MRLLTNCMTRRSSTALAARIPLRIISNSKTTACGPPPTTPEDENKSSADKNPRRKVVGILGGGISGLSAAYYLVQKYGDNVRPIIFEQTGRVGGWIRTVKTEKGSRFEIGPRTIRPAGISGMNTLDMVEELKLDGKVLYVEKTHPTARNRYIYLKGKLVKLPVDTTVLFKKQAPFSRALVWSIFRDVFMLRRIADDDTIYSFVARRFGPEIAEYLADPIIRGICAGDAREISVKFLMKPLYELEQRYGSVVLGTMLSKIFSKSQCKLTFDDKKIGFSQIALASLSGNWAVWTLETGLETLPETLETYLTNRNVQINKNCTVTKINMDKRIDELDVKFYVDGDEKKRDHVTINHLISTVPSHQLGNILRKSKPSHPDLWKVFETVGGATLQVTGLTYDQPHLNKESAFGFLVPSSEKSVEGLLGIVFDSESFPQGDNTVITVMSRGKNNVMQDKEKILWYVNKTLGISREPADYHSEVLHSCIPQYTLGHFEKVEVVRRYIKAAKLPMTLAGASYDGVSVNDCVYSGRRAALEVGKALEFSDDDAVNDSNYSQANKASN